MKRLNKFDTLSPEDRQFVLDLCGQHSYFKVAELLEQDRPVGLNLLTSSTALCRFYTSHHPDAAQTQVLGQYAQAVQARHQIDATGNFEALLALTQNRLLEALKSGRALADLAAEFRILKSLHRSFLDDHEWRRQSGPRQATQDYRRYTSKICNLPECDFLRNDVEEDPGAGNADPDDFADFDDEELWIGAAKRELKEVEEGPNGPGRVIVADAFPPAAPESHTPPAEPTLPSVTPEAPAGQAEHSATFREKSPVIPHIPPKTFNATPWNDHLQHVSQLPLQPPKPFNQFPRDQAPQSNGPLG